MGRISDDSGGTESAADAGEGIPYILRSGWLEPNRLALIDVILARPDAGLFERQLDLAALRTQDLPTAQQGIPASSIQAQPYLRLRPNCSDS
jgi:hypothetical protein